jgi:hypothetical protein
VSVIIGALRTIKKGLDQSLQLLPGHRSATGLQKVTVTLISTAHIICKGLGKWLSPLVEIWTNQKIDAYQLKGENKFKK